jgi:hypothetical protein
MTLLLHISSSINPFENQKNAKSIMGLKKRESGLTVRRWLFQTDYSVLTTVLQKSCEENTIGRRTVRNVIRIKHISTPIYPFGNQKMQNVHWHERGNLIMASGKDDSLVGMTKSCEY